MAARTEYGSVDGMPAKLNYFDDGKIDIYWGGQGKPDGPGHDHVVIWADDMADDSAATASFLRERGEIVVDYSTARHAAQIAICEEAEAIANGTDWKAGGEALKRLRSGLSNLGPARRDFDDAAWSRFKAAERRFRERRTADLKQRERRRDEAREKKEALVAEARSLAGSTNWKASDAKLRDLRRSWKEAGSAGRDHEDRLWRAFNDAIDEYIRAKDRHFKSLDADRERAKSAKKALIREAQGLSRSDDGKAASAGFRKLMDRWKAAGSAGRDEDDRLWKDFKAARENYDARRNASMAKAARAKRDVVREAQALARSDDWKAAGDGMRQLMDRWKAAGSAGQTKTTDYGRTSTPLGPH